MKTANWPLATCILAAFWLFSLHAQAAPSIGGAVDGRVLIGVKSRYGGALTTDLWYGAGQLKIGGVFAVGALSKGSGYSSRVLTPVGLSLAFTPPRDESGLTAIARGGIAAGAKKGGFAAGPWASCALGYGFALGEGASFRLGADVWALLGDGQGIFIAPYLGLGF